MIGGNGTVTNTVTVNNWLDGDPRFRDALPEKTTDPFDMSYPDFTLQPVSSCIDSGAFLTKTKGSGKGTVIQVEDAHYFMDGWGMEEMGVFGDVIQLEGQTQRAGITDVDYRNNIITVDQSLTWDDNQGIGLAYSGSSPDIGAFEYDGTTGFSVRPLQVPGYDMMVYPNPFHKVVTIEYRLPVESDVRMDVYDLSGRLVKTLINASQPAGEYRLAWDAREDPGCGITKNGIYYLRLWSGIYMQTQKIVLLINNVLVKE